MDGRGIALLLAMAGALLGVNCGGSEDKGADDGRGGTANAPQGITCGQNSCPPPEDSTQTACCMDQFSGKCGVEQGSACTEPPPVSASGCPSVGSGALGFVGCCAANGQCGIDVSRFAAQLPDPCIDLATAGAFMPPGGADSGISFNLPSPRPCP